MKTYTLTEVQELLRQLKTQFGSNAKYVCLEIIEALKRGDDVAKWQSIKNKLSSLLPTEEVGIKVYQCEHCGWTGLGSELKTKHLEDRCPRCLSKSVDYVPSDNNNEGASLTSHKD